MRLASTNEALAQLVRQIDFASEHYYNLYFEAAGEAPPVDVSAEAWANLSALTADIGKLRNELSRLRRGVEELRMPAIEAVGLDRVADGLRSVEARLKPLADLPSQAEEESRVRRLLKDLLLVIDTLDRVFELAQSQPGAISEGVRTGLESLYHLARETLARHGLTQFEVKPGDAFNPHEQLAMGTEVRADMSDGTVSRVMLRGYRLGKQILRTAQVVVVKNEQT